ATTTRSRVVARQAFSYTCCTMGLPWMSASGLPTRRVDLNRAGITPSTCIECPLVGSCGCGARVWVGCMPSHRVPEQPDLEVRRRRGRLPYRAAWPQPDGFSVDRARPIANRPQVANLPYIR